MNDSQQRKAAYGGLEYIANVICRFTEVERLHSLNSHDQTTSPTGLAGEIVKLYCNILEFQARAVCQFDRNTARQSARNVVQADSWNSILERIKACEKACEDIRVIVQSSEQQRGMQRLDGGLLEIERQADKNVSLLIEEFKASREEERSWRSSQEDAACLQTLRSTDYESDISSVANRIPGTCEWFLTHEKYQAWLTRSEPGSEWLWVTADPGCGKSVLSKFLIECYTGEYVLGSATICYFFFRDGYEKNHNAENALCSLLHQMFSQKRALLRHARRSYERNGAHLPALFE